MTDDPNDPSGMPHGADDATRAFLEDLRPEPPAPVDTRPNVDTLRKIDQSDLPEKVRLHKRFVEGRTGGARANFSSCDMRYLDLQNLDLSGADFTGANLQHAELMGAKLEASIFFAADLRNADLRKSTFNRADLRGASLRGANMEEAQLVDADLRDGVLLRPDKQGNLTPVSHSAASTDMATAKAGRANMSHAKLSNSFIVQTDLTDANLKNVRFVKADLSHSNLTGANLEGADLTEANLTGCILHGAILYNCIISGTDFADADLAGALFNLSERDSKVFGQSLMPRVLDALGPEMKSLMTNHMAWITSVGKQGERGDFSRRDMSTQSLQGLNFAAAKLEFTVLSKCDMRDAEMLMSDCSFADMRHADLSRADLRGGTFKRANFSDGVLQSVRAGPIQIIGAKTVTWPTRFESARFDNARLRQADFQYAIMSSCDFTGADLRDADFRNAILQDSQFAGADTRGADFTGADTRGASNLVL